MAYSDIFVFTLTKKRRIATTPLSRSEDGARVSIQLSDTLFLFTDYRCADDSSATDEQQGNPQSKIACVAGLRRLRIVRQFSRYGVGFGNFLGCGSVAVIFITAVAVPIFDIALGIVCRLLCLDILEVGVIVRVKLAVGCSADFALGFILAGCFSAGVFGEFYTAVIAIVVFVLVLVFSDCY